MRILTYTVTPEEDGRMVKGILRGSLQLSYTLLKSLKWRENAILLNGQSVHVNTIVHAGDTVSVVLSERTPREDLYCANAAKPDIVYEDENILLVDKKPGVLCHSAGVWDYNTLIANIQAYMAQKGEWRPKEENSFTPALCNRIDRNTGGIVIAAKNAAALRVLNDKIRDREIEKYYLCAVRGRPKPESGRLENYLFKDADKNQVYVKSKPEPGARTAVTEYRVLRTNGALSLVECRLLTGRTHQIRAQMAHAGWPLLGDGKYGVERVNRSYGEKGQALYSYRLEFTFQTDAGCLEYLRGKEFRVKSVDFAEKYFGVTELEF